MEIHIWDQGEEACNINPNEMYIKLNHNLEDYDESEREDIRTNAREFAKTFFDFMDGTQVRFGDECPDCFHKLIDEKCINEHCINHQTHG